MSNAEVETKNVNEMTLGQKIKNFPLYVKHQIVSLKPPGEKPMNPITCLRMLNLRQWQFFFLGLLGWTWDAFDFFSVSLTVTPIAQAFNKQPSDITWGITLTLMLRSVGAAIFGVLGDRYGRKWPYIANLVLLIIFEMSTGFVQTYSQFLAVRALFGISMGGMYGNASATALEDSPIAARGLLSGLLQEGYALGYLLAAVFNLAITGNNPHGWRALYWFGAGPPVLLIIWRFFLPETDAFKVIQQERKEAGRDNVAKGFLKQAKPTLKKHGFRLIYLVLLMAGFNFMSHGSQDLYPTFLERQLGFSTGKVTVTTVVANLGAICGGAIVGHCSTFVGRRLSMIIAAVVGGALIPPWILVRNNGIMAAAFFEQFCVQGAWGVIPIHLLELSPEHFRSFVVGTSYQLGNLVSSASSTIESKIGERFPLPPLANGLTRYDYGLVMAIFMGCVYAYVIVLVMIGPEERKVDHVQEHAAAHHVGEHPTSQSPDWEKLEGEGSGTHRDRAPSESTLEGNQGDKRTNAEKLRLSSEV